MSGLLTALGFLTRLPVPFRRLSCADLGRAAVWFPAVGMLTGGVAAGVRLLAGLVLPDTPATVLALLAAVLVTGGFHEDGLADCADALGAHVGRERRLEIMHDPRVGTYGALALVFATLFAVALLAPLSEREFVIAALAGHVLGRWSTLPHSLVLPPARREGSGSLVRASGPATAVASAYAAAVVLVLAGPAAGAVTLAAVAMAAGLAALGLRRVLGGVTGDTYGAVNKLCELTAYATLAACWS